MASNAQNNHAGGVHIPNMPKLKSFVHSTKPEITIHLNSRRKIYSTMDKITGTVTIKPVVDIEFDDVEIDFIGTSRTFVERYTTAAAISGRSEAYHNFLRLSQPKLDEYYPEDRAARTLRAGKTYEYEFLFKVPTRLLDRVCKHKVNNTCVKEAHYKLPPSLGDQELSSKDGTLDDMAPEMASVRYGIFVRVVKFDGAADSKSIHVAAKARRIRVVPAVEEAPPLDVKGMLEDDIKTEYCVRKEKKLKKSFLMVGNLGTLVMEAAQPEGLRLSAADSGTGHNSITATTMLMLRFEPAKGVTTPPRLDKLTSKLKSRTYFASPKRPTANSTLQRACTASRTISSLTPWVSSSGALKIPRSEALLLPVAIVPSQSKRSDGSLDRAQHTRLTRHSGLRGCHCPSLCQPGNTLSCRLSTLASSAAPTLSPCHSLCRPPASADLSTCAYQCTSPQRHHRTTKIPTPQAVARPSHPHS
jgi:hypothetical protein